MEEGEVVFGAEEESKGVVDNWLEGRKKKQIALKSGLAEKLKTIVEKMKEAGLQSACASFDGCGDNGAVESVLFYDKDGTIFELEKDRQDLPSLVDQFTYDYLDANDIDWYNNDGGYGELSIAANTGKATLNVSTRHIETNDYVFEMTGKGETDDTPAIP